MTQVESTNTETELANAGPDYFDEHGRRIPPESGFAVHHQTRRYFVCDQPQIDYAASHHRIATHLGAEHPLSATAFETRAEAILEGLRRDPRTRRITSGVGVPFFLPKAACDDIGRQMDAVYLKGVQGAYQERFPAYDFVNHHAGGLEGKLSITPGSRHERLLDEMSRSDVVGYYFPCLLEYSIPAALEQMEALPENLLLAGGFDTCAALAGSPDLLLRTDGYPPLLWLAALSGEKAGIGYHFEAYGYNLTFNRRAHLDQAAEYWASGLVAIG